MAARPLRAAPLLAALLAAGAAAASVPEPRTKDDIAVARDAAAVCALIEASAGTHGLPVPFFTRLIWKESRFDAGAVSPKGAQGIAQFMPGTARLRGLANPFDPVAAIPASAGYLGVLRDRFGNVGLAAAAYNAGEARVAAWLAGDRGLPYETRDYVASITGRAAEDWSAELVAPAVPAADDPAASPAEGNGAAPAGVPAAMAALPPEEKDCLGLHADLARGVPMPSAVAAGAWQPWGAQVAGNRSRERALAAFRRLQDRHAEVLGGVAPMVFPSPNRTLGYQIRVGAPSRAEAEAICRRLRSSGGSCVVLRSP